VLNRPPQSRERTATAKQLWREFIEQPAEEGGKLDVHIGFAASFTTNTLIPFLGAHLLRAGIRPSINPGQFNQIFQACLDPKSQFGPDCDTIIVLWRIEDLLLEELLSYSYGEMGAYQRALANMDMFLSALARLRENFPGTIIVSIPPYPTNVPPHISHLENPRAMGTFYRNVIGVFIDKVATISGSLLFDCDALQRNFGAAAAGDTRQWYLYRQPFSELFLAEMGAALGRMIVARRVAPKKCLVVDCDNTLWGGIVGEDGIGGIKIGEDFPGSAYRDFQRLLLHWHRQGVFLALASKNNEADVWEVFDKHTGMILKREHIAAWQINWNPKVENIESIAKSLNIGVDSIVFVDDSAMEVGFMQSARPEVIAVQLPEEPADILTTMHTLTCFDRFEITQEDRRRTEMMRSEQVRGNLGKGLSKAEFFQALELKLDFFQAKPEELDRITQLVNKTNQFNLTTIRRTLDEVRILANGSTHRVYGLRVTDKFGDYGLTGVVIVAFSTDRSAWIIDTLLLSCRVLGRGVEAALVNILVRIARNEGAYELVGTFVPSPKNALASSFLADNGFHDFGERGWRRPLAES
jgi:FkbH-like protein